MNAERLLAHFERISEAPDSIARLRRFILDLAVRGKLVEQDTEDEPAAELLAAISSESQQVKGRRKASPHSAGQVSDGPFGVPSSWEWTQLGAIGDWGSGSTPSRGRSDYYGGATSWFKSGELNDNKCLRESDEKITHLALEQCSFRLNSPGDVLIAMYGATIGKLAILGEEAVTNQAVCACTPCWGVDTEYLYLFLLAQRDEFRLASEGGAQPNISKVKIVNTLIPLPPLAEQHRIVARVDELMALCDQLQAARQERQHGRERLVAATLQRLNQPAADPASFRQDASFALQVLPHLTTTPAQIKQLRQTILNLAVRGKLVEQDPEDEPAEELVRLIADDKKLRMAERRIRAPRNAHSVNSEDVPLDLPPSWKTFPLGDISLVSDPNPSHRYPSYDGGTVPILSTQEFSGLDGWNPSTAKLVQREFHDYQVDSCNFEPGDIVFARKGRIGLPRFLPSLERYAFSHTVFIVKPLCGVYPQYLLWALRRQAVVDWLTKEMNQNTGVPTLGKDKTERLPIPLPPLSEQHRIVAKVDELMALCVQLEQQLSQADQQRRRLLEAVLAEALGGRLPTEQEESHATVA
jgi:type I restriction enzyme S subunit